MGTSNDLNISESGIVTFDGTATFRGRTLTAGAGIIITDGNGVAANPVIASNASSAYAPNAVLQQFDDFIEGGTSGYLSFNPKGQTYDTPGTASHPGIKTIYPNGGNPGVNSGFYISQRDKAGTGFLGPIILGGGITTVNYVIQLSALSSGGNTYRFSCGLADDTTLINDSDSFVNGCYFQYTDSVNSGNWQIKNTLASVTTTANTSTAASTSFVTLSIVVNASATSVAYYIDGNQVGNSPLTTNIPTATLNPFMYMVNTAGTNPDFSIDLFWTTIVLSNPRPGPTSASGSTTYTLIRQYTPTAVSYQVLGTDSVIGVTNTGAARTITMPLAPTTGQEWTVKDVSLGAATNNITINGNGWNIISDASAATYVINTNGGSAEIFFTGTEFIII